MRFLDFLYTCTHTTIKPTIKPTKPFQGTPMDPQLLQICKSYQPIHEDLLKKSGSEAQKRELSSLLLSQKVRDPALIFFRALTRKAEFSVGAFGLPKVLCAYVIFNFPCVVCVESVNEAVLRAARELIFKITEIHTSFSEKLVQEFCALLDTYMISINSWAEIKDKVRYRLAHVILM